MRATDGRPYDLQSVPTKTMTVRISGNCSDPLAMGLVGTEIYIVGASIARPFVMVLSALTGRADAKDVSLQF